MKNVSYKINELLEAKCFEELNAIEREMVLSEIDEEDYTKRYEILLAAQEALTEDKELIVPDEAILSSLKRQLHEQQKQPKKTWPLLGRGIRVSIYKSAAAVLLAILGSYFVFGKTDTKIEYVVQEKVVEKKVYDTVYNEKIVEVPVERIVRVVAYKTPVSRSVSHSSEPYFKVEELQRTHRSATVELDELNNSYGNSKINEEDLEQFRVSL